ncbi:putative fructose-bisphosphate aldolase [Trichoderma lentiforme]|uniref:Fructose-bisphosphate aldolase n=1 Tax=Trichoderma lentiforme TaxID=1567552 RepID=A0A9P4XD76_9HYPO|nr:putative fructose-bisphosphate aldolase [Trichoderma lentiforme]
MASSPPLDHKLRFRVIVRYNLEQILDFVGAVMRKRPPLIIQLKPWAVTYSNDVLAARQAFAPITVHLFDCQDASMIERAFELPSDSIMVAVPHPPRKTKFAKTKEQVVYCQAHNKVATVERSDY